LGGFNELNPVAAAHCPIAQLDMWLQLVACSGMVVDLNPTLYKAALAYLFNRPVPASELELAWYWSDSGTSTLHDAVDNASPLEWVQIQTALFAHSGSDLAQYSNDQVGLGLNYVMNNSISRVSHYAKDPSVPAAAALRMMQALIHLWSDCVGPRLAHIRAPIGSCSAGQLGYVCYMWFDDWPTFYHHRGLAEWRDALWDVLGGMLNVACREVQISALHGIGHQGRYLQRQPAIDLRVAEFCRNADPLDTELIDYAHAACHGHVQ
jgi:hypothetical protein